MFVSLVKFHYNLPYEAFMDMFIGTPGVLQDC